MISEFRCLITPDNFSHKAGDGTTTRKHHTALIHPALQANCGTTQQTLALLEGSENVTEQYRIRKLTPTETYRLQGWQDNDIQKVKDIDMSDTQMYRQAGNGICVPCVELLFEHLYKAQYDENYECYDETFLKASLTGT